MKKILFRKKHPRYYHGLWVPNLIKKILFKKKKNKITMAHECQIWYLVTRLYILWNEDFFGSPLKTFPLEIVELVEKLEDIKQIKINMGLWNLTFPSYGTLKRGHTFLFSTRQIFCQKILYHVVAMVVLKRFRVVTHCCTASFSIKTFFGKTNNILYSLENRIWGKTK